MTGATELVAVQPAGASYAAIALPSASGSRHAAAQLIAPVYWPSSAAAAARIRALIPRLGGAGWRQYVPRAWYRYLRVQDVVAIAYLCYTLPLCFVAPQSTGATPILFRLIMLPLYLLARPISFVLPYPSTEPMGPVTAKPPAPVERDGLLDDDQYGGRAPGVYGDSALLDCCNRCCSRLLWAEADGCGCRRHAATGEYARGEEVPCCGMPRAGVLTMGWCGRGCTWYLYLCAYKLWSALVVVLPWFIYPVGYGETGKFISAVHPSTVADQCQNDPIVQAYDDTIFGSQVSVTWRGDSTSVGHRLLAEYLQICYFGLYVCVVGVPAALYWIAHHNRTKRAAAAAAAQAAASAAAVRPGGLVDVTGAPAAAAPAAAGAQHGSPHASPLTQSIPPRTPVAASGSATATTFGSPSVAGTATAANGSFMAGTPRGGADATHTSRDTLVTVFGTPAPAAVAAANAVIVGAERTVSSSGGGNALSIQVHPTTTALATVEDGAAAMDAGGGAAVDLEPAYDDEPDAETAMAYGSDATALAVDEEARYDMALVALLGVSMVCWVVYLFFPVAGPFWCFPRPPKANVGYVFPYVLAYIQEQGAAHGTATPSSHCAVTVSLWILCMLPRYGGKKLALSLAFIVPGLVVATVWLQYHYGFDAFVGVQMALLLAPLSILFTTWATRRLRLKRLPSVNLIAPAATAPPKLPAAVAGGAALPAL